MIDFPTDADIGDSYTFNRITFILDSEGWGTSGQPFLYVNENGAISFDGGLTFGDSGDVPVSRDSDQSPLWEAIGAAGAGPDKIFWENDHTITTSYTVSPGKNAVTAGPIRIDPGVVITIDSNQSWSIV